jgi:4-amino-4-deoxy-L-arabinose transferase-like glycosyltransferase
LNAATTIATGAVPSEVTTRTSDRRWAGTLCAITAVGLAVRTTFVLSTQDIYRNGDAAYYHFQANLLATGHGFVEPYYYRIAHQTLPSAYHPPLWTLYLAAFSVLGLKSWLAHRLAGCVLGAATVALMGVVGRRVGGPRVGLVVAGLTAVYPLIWINDAVGLSESIVLFACALVLLTAYRVIDRPGVGRAAWLGVACGLAALARTEQALLLVTLVVPLLVVLRARPMRQLATMGGACALAAGLTVAPWIGRNLVAFDHPVLMSTNIDPTLVVTNCAQTFDQHSPFFAFWDVDCLQGVHTHGDESDQDITLRHVAVDFLSHHRRQIPLVVLARAGRLWNLYRPLEGTRLDLIESRPLWVSRTGLGVFAALVPMAVGGIIVLRRRRITAVPLLALPVTVTVTAMLTYGNTRFRAPAELSLVVLAAVVLDAGAARWWPGATVG